MRAACIGVQCACVYISVYIYIHIHIHIYIGLTLTPSSLQAREDELACGADGAALTAASLGPKAQAAEQAEREKRARQRQDSVDLQARMRAKYGNGKTKAALTALDAAN